MIEDSGFLGRDRLLNGPWQAFERDVARLLLANGFQDVRLVAGTGDHGADILAARGGEIWVVQCKHTTASPPPSSAVEEIVNAAEFYDAEKLVIACSRPPSDGLLREKSRYERLGLKIDLAVPAVLINWMQATPEYAPARRTLRDYQEDASTRLREALLDTGRGQIVMATGLGKTVVMAETVADLLRDNRVEHGRILVLAHTVTLVNQLQQAFWFQLPRWVHTHRLAEGETPTYWDGITFATIQSVTQRLEHLPQFGLVVVDEAHHAGAETFLQAIAALRPRMLAGVTATPWRGDAYDIDRIFGPALVRLGVAEGLAKGFLAEVDYRLLADNIDWEFVQQRSRNKYSISQLNRKLIIPTRDDMAARLVRQVFDGEKRHCAIVYSPSGAHAKSFAGTLRQYGFRAEVILFETPPRTRDKLMSQFRSGRLDIVVTVDLFNEGVDVPDVDLIIFMRVTHSRRIFVQQLGRGLRFSRDKDKVVVLDFVTDLRRVAEVLELDKAIRGDDVERVGLGGRLVSFGDQSAGSFLKEWILDQSSLVLREDDAELQLPEIDYPDAPPPGSVQ
ncbi:MAG: ATP-dependent RNA helicase RhlB [Phycisphaerae bacterium]|nr:ATP-dependent RNA helicase RhlB [Phycisphaerae bacterium]